MSRTRNHSCSCWLCRPDARAASHRDAKRTVENPKDLAIEDEPDYDFSDFDPYDRYPDCDCAVCSSPVEWVVVDPVTFETAMKKVFEDLALEMALLAPNDTHETFPPPSEDKNQKDS